MALLFDGSDDNVQFDNATAIEDASLGLMTLCAWIRLDENAFDNTDTPRIMDKNATSTAGFAFYVERLTGTTSGTARLKYIQYSSLEGKWRDNTNTLSWGASAPWYHVAVRRDGGTISNQPTFTFNGADASTTTELTQLTSGGSDSGSKLYLGDSARLNRRLGGEIARPRMYTRLLPESEIATVYEMGGIDRIVHNLAFDAPLNEGTVGTSPIAGDVVDVSDTQANNSTIGSAPVYSDDPIRRQMRRR